MNIAYEVLKHEGDQAVVRITPQVPLNGFHGCDLTFSRNMLEGSEETAENFIEKRVHWKVKQQVGLAIEHCRIEKI
jgi:hypothetical protein